MYDLISRQTTIELVKKYFEFIELNPDLIVDSIISLPSAQPEILACGEGELISNPDVPDTNAGDLISRRAAIDLLRKRLIETANNNVGFTCDAGQVFEDASERIRYWIDELPSAQPERKTGKWIEIHGFCTPGGDPVWACSECGKGVHVYGIEHGTYGADVSDGQWKACPNCGCRMEGEEHETD